MQLSVRERGRQVYAKPLAADPCHPSPANLATARHMHQNPANKRLTEWINAHPSRCGEGERARFGGRCSSRSGRRASGERQHHKGAGRSSAPMRQADLQQQL